jgi:FAD/FMN-containing dehydrogenase
VTVQTGISMGELHQALQEHAYTTGFPTRAWGSEPLGAVLAAAQDAHWGPPYGTSEGQVLGLGAIFPDGAHTRTKIVPRKAVGPDFVQFFLGSRGRYGIIYEVTLRIYPAAARVVLAYGAADLKAALDGIKIALEDGLTPRAVEVLTPAIDRRDGAIRVGLTEETPVLVLIEPWALDNQGGLGRLELLLEERLTRLHPPVGWNVHQGLLPPPRDWTSSVVGVPWAELDQMASQLGNDVPPGLWIVRMSRHGGWLSLAEGGDSQGAKHVRDVIATHEPAETRIGADLQTVMKQVIDPNAILNPS